VKLTAGIEIAALKEYTGTNGLINHLRADAAPL
jgi:hypothetical protein